MGPGGEWVPRVGKEMRTLEEKNTRILDFRRIIYAILEITKNYARN